MKRLLILFALIAGALCAQPTLPQNVSFPTFRTQLNTYLTWLNTNKAASNASTTVNGQTCALGSTCTVVDSAAARLSHLHLIADITNLQTALDGKSPTNHDHNSVYQAVSAILTQFSALACSEGQIPKRGASAWECASDATGGVGGGADANGYYLVSRAANAPTNAVNLGLLTTGLLKHSVSGGVSTIATATADTDYLTPGTAASTYEPKNANIQAHISNTSNPHSVTKSQVGLGNADNTSDANKPISTATQAALDAKAPATSGTAPLKGNGTGGTSAATAADIVALWTACTGYLKNDGTCSSPSAAPAGSDTQVQFNDGGVMAGDAGMTYDKTTDTLTVGYLVTTGSGPEEITEQAAPGGSPAAGKLYCWADSANKGNTCRDSSGNTYRDVKPVTSTANQFLTNIGNDGVQTKAQPAFSNLSGSVAASQMPALTGDVTTSAGAVATTLAAAYKVRTCEIVIGDPGAASSALADDNDTPAVCGNLTGATMTITEVKCMANAGSPTVNPIITGGAATSILSSAVTCGTGSFGSAGTLNGTPTQSDGASIDGNIATAGGTAKYLVIRIKRTL